MGEAAVSGLAGFLSNVGTVITSITSWMGTFLEVVVDTPVLLVPIGIGVAGGVIGLYHALK